MNKKIETKLKRWSDITGTNLVDKYNKILAKVKELHPEYTAKEASERALDVIRVKCFRGTRPAPGERRKATLFTGVKVGDTRVIDRVDTLRRIRRYLCEKDPEAAKRKGWLKDGVLIDDFEFIRIGRNLVKNENFGKPLDNRHDYFRMLFFILDYNGEKVFATMDAYGPQAKILDCPSNKTVTFPALLLDTDPRMRLRVSRKTKFVESPTQWEESMEELILRAIGPEVIDIERLREVHNAVKSKAGIGRYMWTRGELRRGYKALPDPDTGKIIHWLLPINT